MTIEKVNNAPVAAAAANKEAEAGELNGRKVSRLEKGLKAALVVGAVVLGVVALAALVSSAVVYLFPALSISGSIVAGLSASAAALGTGVNSLAGLVTLYPLYTAIAGAVGVGVLGLSGGAYALYKYISNKDDVSVSSKKEEAKPAEVPAAAATPVGEEKSLLLLQLKNSKKKEQILD